MIVVDWVKILYINNLSKIWGLGEGLLEDESFREKNNAKL
jgi:hypothetical protein